MKKTRKVLIEKDLPKEKKEKISFDNLSFFKEAYLRKICGFGYNVRRFKLIWKHKKVAWNWIAIEWGIRNSDFVQILPVWNVSHNGQRALVFGFWRLYFSILYNRKNSFNQQRNFPFRQKLWKFYQLVL